MRVYKFIDARWGEEAIRRKRLKISLFDELNDPFDGKCAKFSKDERVAWDKSFKQFSKSYGVLCFSESWKNPVLWTHYADNHQGICLGFDLDESVPLKKVAYQSDLLDGRGLSERSHDEKLAFVKKAYSTKFVDWSYEAEQRAFCDLDEPDASTGKYFLDFEPDMKLREVIFGARFRGDAPYLRKCMSDSGLITFKTARLAFETFSIVEQNRKSLQK